MWIKICGPETKKASPGGCKDQRSISHSPRSVTPFGQIQLGGKRSSTESIVLQSNTKGPGKSNQSYNAPCQLSPASKEELDWWTHQLARWNGKSPFEVLTK